MKQEQEEEPEEQEEEWESNYIKYESLEKDSQKALDFIHEELGVESLENYFILFDRMKEIIQEHSENQEKGYQKEGSTDLGYIG